MNNSQESLLAILGLFQIGLFALSIFLVIWVYRDAKSRGANVALWTIIVLFTGLIGWLIYMLAGRNAQGGNQKGSGGRSLQSFEVYKKDESGEAG